MENATHTINLSDHSVEDLKKNLGTDILPLDAINAQGENLLQQALKDKNKDKIELLFKCIDNLKSQDLDLYKKVINHQMSYEKEYSPYNIMQPKGMTVLMYVIKYYPEILEKMLNFPYLDLTLTNSNKHNAVAFACADKNVTLDVIKLLIAEYGKKKMSYVERDNREQSILMLAMITGDLERIKYLISLDIFSLFYNCSGQGALHFVSRSGNSEAFEYVLGAMKEGVKRKMDEEVQLEEPDDIMRQIISFPTYSGITVLGEAARGFNGNGYDMLQHLIEKYFDLNDEFNRNLFKAHTNGGYDLFHTVCTFDAYDIGDNSGKDKIDTLKFLLSRHEFDVNGIAIGANSLKRREKKIKQKMQEDSPGKQSHETTSDKKTIHYNPEHLSQRSHDMVQDLLKYHNQGSDQEKFNYLNETIKQYKDGVKYKSNSYVIRTHLAMAIRTGNTVVIEFLLEKGALFDITAFRGFEELEKAGWRDWPGYTSNRTRYEETQELLINGGFIVLGDNGLMQPANLEKLLSSTDDVLKAFDMRNYLRVRDIYSRRYNDDRVLISLAGETCETNRGLIPFSLRKQNVLVEDIEKKLNYQRGKFYACIFVVFCMCVLSVVLVDKFLFVPQNTFAKDMLFIKVITFTCILLVGVQILMLYSCANGYECCSVESCGNDRSLTE